MKLMAAKTASAPMPWRDFIAPAASSTANTALRQKLALGPGSGKSRFGLTPISERDSSMADREERGAAIGLDGTAVEVLDTTTLLSDRHAACANAMRGRVAIQRHEARQCRR